MATRAELQQAVNEKTEAANAARTEWKDAIPDPDAPKMTDDELAVVDALHDVYNTAANRRKDAEGHLADFDTAETARKAAAAASAPVASPVASSTSGSRDSRDATDDELKALGYI